jgi:DNA-binding winged helix-turn-helix (wHTH) protein
MKLRDALGDSAEEPLYIETIPKRGYRFVAPVSLGLAWGVRTPEDPQSVKSVPSKGYRFRNRSVDFSAVEPAEIRAERRRIMLAVLPFENLSGDSGQEYFSDGLAEEMITRLGQLSPLQMAVIGRTSSMAYKGPTRPLPG